MNVKDLIKFLKTQPQDALVTYQCCSERCLLELEEINLIEACEPRDDGWVQDKRPDMKAITYLEFPGN